MSIKKDKELDGPNEKDKIESQEKNETFVKNEDESGDHKIDGAENSNEKVDNTNDKIENVTDKVESTNDKLIKDEKVNSTLNDEETVEGFDKANETEKDKTVTCIFLINVKYNKDIKKIGDSIELDLEEAEFLEREEVLQIVRK